MVFKLGNVADMNLLPSLDPILLKNIHEFLSVLDNEYGADRDVDNDDGGYVIFATKGTNVEEVSKFYDVIDSVPEWVNTIKSDPDYCAALYLTNNEYVIVIIMAITDAPKSITNEISEQY